MKLTIKVSGDKGYYSVRAQIAPSNLRGKEAAEAFLICFEAGIKDYLSKLYSHGGMKLTRETGNYLKTAIDNQLNNLSRRENG